MNVIISIRNFNIIIKDSVIEKVIRKITEFELMFCKNHNLLMLSRNKGSGMSSEYMIMQSDSQINDTCE